MNKQKIVMCDNRPTTIREAIAELIKSKRRIGCVQPTIEFYEVLYKVLPKFTSIDEPVTKIDSAFSDTYILWLQSRGTANATVITYVRMFRAFVYFLMEKEWIDRFKVSLPRKTQTMKQIYTDDELRKLLKSPNKKCSFVEYRDWTFINYIFGTGQRLSTAMAIQNGDIDCDNGLVYLRHMKNRKQTILPLTDSLVGLLEDYKSIRKGLDTDQLFCNQHGGFLKPTSMRTSIKRYNHSRGVKKTSIHLLRHTFAVHWVRQNGDIAKLQRILCHSDLRVTQQYLDLSYEDLRVDMTKMNPLEKLRPRKLQL